MVCGGGGSGRPGRRGRGSTAAVAVLRSCRCRLRRGLAGPRPPLDAGEVEARPAARGRARRGARRRRGSRRRRRRRRCGPADRITARSHSSAANGRSWVATSIVRSIALQDLEQLAAAARVEVGRRLVEHEQVGPHREHGGDRHPPPLAHRELVRRAVRRACSMRTAASASATRARDLLARQAHVERAERDVLATVGMKSWSSGSWKTRPTRGAARAARARHVDPGDLELPRRPSAGRSGAASASSCRRRWGRARPPARRARRAGRRPRSAALPVRVARSARPVRVDGAAHAATDHPQRHQREQHDARRTPRRRVRTLSGVSCGICPL